MKRNFLLCFALSLLTAFTAKADNWMARLDDNTLLTSLCIPGTHDAGTGDGFMGQYADFGKQFGQTQECSIAQQWAVGVRAFDLRPAIIEENGEKHIQIFHGVLETKASFERTLQLLIDSLTVNPSEFAVVVFRHEGDGDKNSEAWGETMKQFLNKEEIKSHIIAYAPTLRVKEMRGKILVMARDKYDTDPVGAYVEEWTSDEDLNAQKNVKIHSLIARDSMFKVYGNSPLFVQDYYETIGDHMAIKLSNIKRMIDISCGYATDDDTRPLIINHMSAYALEAQLNGESFATSDGYRYNASRTNKATIKYLKKAKNPSGLFMMDYAGVNKSGKYKVMGLKLVKAIIEKN